MKTVGLVDDELRIWAKQLTSTLATWMQHREDCGRAYTADLRCTCGLEDVWKVIESTIPSSDEDEGSRG